MTRNILLTLAISLFTVTVGFTSCKHASKGNTESAENLLMDSSQIIVPDTTLNQQAVADTSWEEAAQAFSTEEPVQQDTSGISGKKPSGRTKIKPLKRFDPFRPQQLLDGLELAKAGDLRGAIVYFDSCIVKNYKNHNAYFYKAKAFIELNEPQNALPNLNLAIEYNPENSMFYYYRGKLNFDLGKTQQAYDDFNKAVSKKADFPDALNYRGVTKELMGKHAEAIDDYNAALALNPKFATAHYNKGTSEAAMQKYKEATASFSQCLVLDPTKIMGFLNRGNCYVMLKDYTAAVADYTSAIALDPKNADAYYNRGAAYQLAGDNNACPDWRKAQSLGHKRAADVLKEYCK